MAQSWRRNAPRKLPAFRESVPFFFRDFLERDVLAPASRLQSDTQVFQKR